MEENYFRLNPDKINQNYFSLNKAESNHFLKSLRGNIGDEIWLLDGLGIAYKGVICSINDECISGDIINSFNDYGEPNYNINLIMDIR